MRRIPVFLLVVSLLSVGASHAFQLQSMDSTRVHLTDYLQAERWNLVMFWSTDCIPCEQQKPMIEAFHQTHRNTRAVVLGVALDGMENIAEINRLMKKNAPSYPNLVVFTDVFHRQFKELTGQAFRATPTYLLFAPDGTLRGARTGPIERSMLEAVVSSENP